MNVAALSERIVIELHKRPVPMPGIYYGMTFDEYKRLDAASNTELGQLARSPAHLHHYLHALETKSDDDTTGQALHCAVLEPDAFSARFVKGPLGDGRTKKVQDQTAALRQEFPDAQILRPWMFDKVIAMRDSVMDHPAARWTLDQCPLRELSIVWHDPFTGVLCKGRIDAASPVEAFIADVKTARNAKPAAFHWSIFKFAYDRQAAFYLDGINALAPDFRDFLHIAVEKEPPYPVAVLRLDDAAITRARGRIAPLLMQYAECRARDQWPGYGDEIFDVGVIETPYTFNDADD